MNVNTSSLSNLDRATRTGFNASKAKSDQPRSAEADGGHDGGADSFQSTVQSSVKSANGPFPGIYTRQGRFDPKSNLFQALQTKAQTAGDGDGDNDGK